jgi:outer membrane protein OmpA-like peptidoglycan-associated protein
MAMRKLEEANAVKRDPRGLVITMSGTVRFQSGQADVIPSAHERLVEVCTAIKDQPGKIVVEGHTDSEGSSESNMILSRRRTESVLAASGIPRGRMEAIGYGESRPIADNAAPEGRPNNRRVGLVIRPETAVTSQL